MQASDMICWVSCSMYFPVVVCSQPIRAAQAAVDSGADAIKVHIRLGHRASGHHFSTLAEDRNYSYCGNRYCPRRIVPGAEDLYQGNSRLESWA